MRTNAEVQAIVDRFKQNQGKLRMRRQIAQAGLGLALALNTLALEAELIQTGASPDIQHQLIPLVLIGLGGLIITHANTMIRSRFKKAYAQDISQLSDETYNKEARRIDTIHDSIKRRSNIGSAFLLAGLALGEITMMSDLAALRLLTLENYVAPVALACFGVFNMVTSSIGLQRSHAQEDEFHSQQMDEIEGRLSTVLESLSLKLESVKAHEAYIDAYGLFYRN